MWPAAAWPAATEAQAEAREQELLTTILISSCNNINNILSESGAASGSGPGKGTELGAHEKFEYGQLAGEPYTGAGVAARSYGYGHDS